MIPVIFSFIVGSVVGSFLNMCIYRLPRPGLSPFKPLLSFCPVCKETIAWYDNIPLLSWLLLGGRCRHCTAPILRRYFVVELLTASLFMGMFLKFGNQPQGVWLILIYDIFVSLLIVATFIDLELLIIPDSISYSGILIGLGASAAFPVLMDSSSHLHGALLSVIGVLVSGGTLLVIAMLGSWILKKEAMGMGDPKLLAMISSFIGLGNAFLTIFLSSVIGLAVALLSITLGFSKRENKIPYGPYLSLGAVICLFWGRDLFEWYWGLWL